MKVLLISANTLRIPYPVYPLGLDYVAGSLDSRYQTKIVDLNEFNNLEELGMVIREFSPDFVGVSIRNIDNTDTINSRGFLAEYQNLVRQIRKNSKAKLILGGSGFTIFPVEFLQALDADYGIVGEGERLPLLLEALEKNADVKSIPGIVTKETSILLTSRGIVAINRSFDPASSHTQFYLSYGGMLNLQTKRGCPFRCSYCTYPHIEGSRMRFFPPHEIARKARELQDAGAKYIFITDSAFNASYDHSLQVAKAFIKARLSIPWGGFFAPTIPPADYYQESGGCRLDSCGIRHGIFIRYNAYQFAANLLSPRDVFSAHHQASKAGLHIAHYFLLGGPGENKQTLQETLMEWINWKSLFFSFFAASAFIRIPPCMMLL